jgi:predicted GH43/DUF377 family glycosyl hydrolase
MHPVFLQARRVALMVVLLAPLTCLNACHSTPQSLSADPMKTPRMYFGDTSRLGRPFSKDLAVVRFQGRYLLYYSIPPVDRNGGWGIGIAESHDLTDWTRIGEIAKEPNGPEAKGFCAPGAIVLKGKVHLFYQTYGNGKQDAICHAWSEDGVTFRRDPSNPVFRPTGAWNCGRAIDADVVEYKGQLWLYWATRDPAFKIQMLGVATAPMDSDFSRGAWTQRSDGPILKPELPWEQQCIEAPAVCKRGGKLYMFYAGAYNNAPQQIGCAVSSDGLTWKRLSDKPVLPNGQPGEWNASESGHPGVFQDEDGRIHLFYQGNHDQGRTWFLSRQEVHWNWRGFPRLVEPRR